MTAMMSGVMPAHSCANSLPVRPTPLCPRRGSSEAVLVAKLPDCLQRRDGHWADAALALHGLEQDRGGLGVDRLPGRLDIGEG